MLEVQVQDLVKHYDDTTAVDGISFNVDKGEVFAFLGPNGAGKTTTVEILECLRSLSKGSALVCGYDITKDKDVEEIKKNIGVLPQDFNALDKLTVKENIELIADMYDKHLKIEDVIKLLNLEDKANSKFENLSGGLKQRVGIAAALVSDPKLVFLDEPTTGLDPKARRDVWDVLANLKKIGKTVFLTTHYMEEAQVLATRIAIVNKGKIAAMGSPQELIDEYGGLKILIIRKADENLAKKLGDKFEHVTMNSNGDIHIKIDNTDELYSIMSLLTAMKAEKDIEIQTPTLEDVFLKITGSKIRRRAKQNEVRSNL